MILLMILKVIFIILYKLLISLLHLIILKIIQNIYLELYMIQSNLLLDLLEKELNMFFMENQKQIISLKELNINNIILKIKLNIPKNINN